MTPPPPPKRGHIMPIPSPPIVGLLKSPGGLVREKMPAAAALVIACASTELCCYGIDYPNMLKAVLAKVGLS